MQVKDGKDGGQMRGAAMHCTTRQASARKNWRHHLAIAETGNRAPENLLAVVTLLDVTFFDVGVSLPSSHKR